MSRKYHKTKKFHWGRWCTKRGWTIQDLVYGVIKAAKTGLTTEEIRVKIWDKYHLYLTHTQINGAVAHLRIKALLEPYDTRRWTPTQKTSKDLLTRGRKTSKPKSTKGNTHKTNVVPLFKKPKAA